jgi:hypothetical protein
VYVGPCEEEGRFYGMPVFQPTDWASFVAFSVTVRGAPVL